MLFGTDTKLTPEDNDKFEYISQYKNLIKALQYLTLVRPELSFSINKLSQFLQFQLNCNRKPIKEYQDILKNTKIY